MASGKVAKKLPRRTGKAQKLRMMENSKKRCADRKARNRKAQDIREAANRRIIESYGVAFSTLTERRTFLKKMHAAA